MPLTSPIPFIPFLIHLLHPLALWREPLYRRLLFPPPAALVRGSLGDLTYTKSELLAENALLRNQLGILHRQIKRPPTQSS